MLKKHTSGFTLIELLIVIGILAILAAAVVLIMQPLMRLKETRDSARMQDLTSLDQTISILQTQTLGLPLGTSSVVYVSLPDTSATCANLGLPTLPSGYIYNCVTAANLRDTDGTGWIPINFQSSSVTTFNGLPVDPINTTSTGLYYRYIPNATTYHLEALLESNKYISLGGSDGGSSPAAFEKGTNKTLMPAIFPTGYVKVPGNSAFGTSDFYVMQYEAKYDKSGDGIGDNSTTYSCIASSGDGWDWSDAGCATGGQGVVSSANGSPIVSITHTQAVAACAAQGAHLLTNDEYMTIARDAEQQGANWTSGTVGTGYLFNGNSADLTRGYDGADPEKGTNRNPRAKYVLSNKSEIYDLAGNVWEHVQRSVNNQGDNTSAIALPACSDSAAAWGYCDYGSTTAPYVTSWTADVVRNLVGPSNTSWDVLKGMGRVYTYKNGTGQGTSIFLRGACWSCDMYSGAFALNLGWGTADALTQVGFRCAR